MPAMDMTLREARDWVSDRLTGGVQCPCCDRKVRLYKRTINRGMAVALATMYAAAKTDWAHKPTVLRGVGSAARDESLLTHWGLFEESLGVREDGGRAGWWRVTEDGERFLRGALTVPRHVYLLNNQPLLFEGEHIDIHDALGNHFDLQKLLAGNA